jgi:hypothetical protein
MMWLTAAHCFLLDWLIIIIIMICPGDLLLVVCPPRPICCRSLSFYGFGCEKGNNNLNLDVRNIFAGSLTYPAPLEQIQFQTG